MTKVFKKKIIMKGDNGLHAIQKNRITRSQKCVRILLEWASTIRGSLGLSLALFFSGVSGLGFWFHVGGNRNSQFFLFNHSITGKSGLLWFRKLKDVARFSLAFTVSQNQKRSQPWQYLKRTWQNSRNNCGMARISNLFQYCNEKSTRILKMWINSHTIDIRSKKM